MSIFGSNSTSNFKKVASQSSDSDILKRLYTSFGKLVLGDEKTNPILSKYQINKYK